MRASEEDASGRANSRAKNVPVCPDTGREGERAYMHSQFLDSLLYPFAVLMSYCCGRGRAYGMVGHAACCIAICTVSAVDAQLFLCGGHALDEPLPAAKGADAVRRPVLPARGSIYILTVFARFADEQPTPVPEWADQLFDAERTGSFAHFYRAMSFGQLTIAGEVLPRRLAASQAASAYLADAPGQVGRYGDFVREILAQVDAQINLAHFDNDGPDGVPNSGDDDGWVDYIFINMQSVPNGFLLGSATGLAGLGLAENPFVSQALGSNGRPIRVSGLPSQGAIQATGNFAQTVGVMAHEFGHSLGLPDFFDTSFLKNPAQHPAEDSAGIGRWGLMGWGAHGWDGLSGPVPFSARSLEQLGWIGAKNERLIWIKRDRWALQVRDLYAGGAIYKIPLRAETPNNNTLWTEYLLLEYRGRNNYYHRGEPAAGLLVWHVRPQVFDNDDEQRKHLDLVAADGQYADAGFPIGQTADRFAGRDNLDFWAHDASYAQARAGNLGDASDLFDGVRYRRLAVETNPSTLAAPTLSAATTGLALQNMRPDGDGLMLDVEMPRWGGVLREEVHWAGEVLMDGDHSIDTCDAVTRTTLRALYVALAEQDVHLEGTVLKASMVLSGKGCADQAPVAEVADRTVACLRNTVPAAVPGIVFLSGGQTAVQSTEHLNAMNAGAGALPWRLSFSYGRALQEPALKAWAGQADNADAARRQLALRARLNGLATLGEYRPEMEAV